MKTDFQCYLCHHFKPIKCLSPKTYNGKSLCLNCAANGIPKSRHAAKTQYTREKVQSYFAKL